MPADNRDDRGRFVQGNAGGPGNPYARQVAEHRKALMDAVTPNDVKRVVRVLIDKALSGDIQAARILLDRLLGPPVAADVMARI